MDLGISKLRSNYKSMHAVTVIGIVCDKNMPISVYVADGALPPINSYSLASHLRRTVAHTRIRPLSVCFHFWFSSNSQWGDGFCECTIRTPYAGLYNQNPDKLRHGPGLIPRIYFQRARESTLKRNLSVTSITSSPTSGFSPITAASLKHALIVVFPPLLWHLRYAAYPKIPPSDMYSIPSSPDTQQSAYGLLAHGGRLALVPVVKTTKEKYIFWRPSNLELLELEAIIERRRYQVESQP